MYIEIVIILIIIAAVIYSATYKRHYDWRDIAVSIVGFFVLSGELNPTWTYRAYCKLTTERAKNQFAWSALIATAYCILTAIGFAWMAISWFLRQIAQPSQMAKNPPVIAFIIFISVLYLFSAMCIQKYLERIKD